MTVPLPADPFFAKLECDVERIHELINLDWFRQISEESGLQTLVDVARHCIRAERNDGHVSRCCVFMQNSERLEAADVRQVDVHKDYFRLTAARKLDTATSVDSGK